MIIIIIIITMTVGDEQADSNMDNYADKRLGEDCDIAMTINIMINIINSSRMTMIKSDVDGDKCDKNEDERGEHDELMRRLAERVVMHSGIVIMVFFTRVF